LIKFPFTSRFFFNDKSGKGWTQKGVAKVAGVTVDFTVGFRDD